MNLPTQSIARSDFPEVDEVVTPFGFTVQIEKDSGRVVQYGVQCETCDAVLFSNSRHDFVTCACGEYVDGGFDYMRATTSVKIVRRTHNGLPPTYYKLEAEGYTVTRERLEKHFGPSFRPGPWVPDPEWDASDPVYVLD